jgi:hypothetical protein
VESLAETVTGLVSELEETLTDEVREIIENKVITMGAVQILSNYVEVLQGLKEERGREIDSLTHMIDELYSLLMIEASDRLPAPTKRSQAVIDDLNKELSFLNRERDVRLPRVVQTAEREFTKLCDHMRIPTRIRPKFTGEGLEAKAVFLLHQIEELKKVQVRSQPIIDCIKEIESLRDVIEGRRSKDANHTPKRMSSEEKSKRDAQERLPKVEGRLLSLLIEFKETNGYNFVFNGVNCLATLTSRQPKEQQPPQISPRRSPKHVSPRHTEVSLGEEILLKKIAQMSGQVRGEKPGSLTRY